MQHNYYFRLFDIIRWLVPETVRDSCALQDVVVLWREHVYTSNGTASVPEEMPPL